MEKVEQGREGSKALLTFEKVSRAVFGPSFGPRNYRQKFAFVESSLSSHPLSPSYK